MRRVALLVIAAPAIGMWATGHWGSPTCGNASAARPDAHSLQTVRWLAERTPSVPIYEYTA